VRSLSGAYQMARATLPLIELHDWLSLVRYANAVDYRSVSSDAAGSSSAFTDPAASTGRPEDGSNPIRASTSIAVSIEAAGFNAPLARDESRGRVCARQGFVLACQAAASHARGARGEGPDKPRA